MSGYVYLEREIFYHPLFATNQPFSEREAFIWLFTHANFADGLFRHNMHVFTIPRGSYATSYRALAATWKWSPNRVIRVFGLWKNQRMIDVGTEHGFVHVTLCNYESYQNRRNGDGTPAEQRRNADGTVTDTNQRKGKEGKEGKEKKYSAEFGRFWAAYPANNASKKEAADSYNQAITKGIPHDRILQGAHAYRQHVESHAIERKFIAHATTWLNRERWTIDYAAQSGTAFDRLLAGLEQPAGGGHHADDSTPDGRVW